MVDPSSSRLPRLDGLRGLAILLVVVWHYIVVPITPADNPVSSVVSSLLSLTWSGVDLFFVLSGFLVGGILLDHLRSSHYYRAFFVRRAARILPLYFVWVGLFVLGTFLIPTQSVFRDAHPLWTYVALVQNIPMALTGTWGATWFSVTWSLAIEAQFYVVIPMFLRCVPRARLPYILVMLIATAPVLRALTVGQGFELAAYTLLPARMDALLLGVLCAWLVRVPQALDFLKAHRTDLHRLTALVGTTGWLFWQLPIATEVPRLSVGYFLVDVFYACLLLAVLMEGDSILSRLTEARPLIRLGVIAYGVYLIHLPIVWLARDLLWQEAHFALLALAAFLATLALASSSWTKFESKVVARSRRVSYGPISPAPPDPAPVPGAAIP